MAEKTYADTAGSESWTPDPRVALLDGRIVEIDFFGVNHVKSDIRGHKLDFSWATPEADDLDEATRQWRRVLGDRFKATQKTKASASAFGAFAAATPAPGYSFPDAMAAPNKKPRGFA